VARISRQRIETGSGWAPAGASAVVEVEEEVVSWMSTLMKEGGDKRIIRIIRPREPREGRAVA
jgi:hypothetical protein